MVSIQGNTNGLLSDIYIYIYRTSVGSKAALHIKFAYLSSTYVFIDKISVYQVYLDVIKNS